ncbi:MAG: hypothetical protein HOM14_03820 [Gammaproteobacteria bacterium]|jgi:hypothetical protein|nr:hypothetical protein [Chloroflexota bacterium]MBT3205224.1 hypothetical protein [Gammaproteobacteria bacterium]MBT4075742.1 hypothetical protein [Gammaproteobacteria bacterium]MBT4194796.1 hypothetical protein [Gammaproteobacteria bacterium]MBT4451252.1 hypothetical protein [Gammaproteobacteria bacterium]
MNERKSYLRWLDTASIPELERKLIRLESIEFRLTDPDVIAEYNWIKGKLIEEMDIRRQLGDMENLLVNQAG